MILALAALALPIFFFNGTQSGSHAVGEFGFRSREAALLGADIGEIEPLPAGKEPNVPL